MLSIRKRQSGRLARLILEHSRDEWSYELRAGTKFPKGIDPPCVAVIDLDQVPRNIVESRYSTQADLYGHLSMLMLIQTMITLAVHVFSLFERGWVTRLNWVYCAIVNLSFCSFAVFRGDGTLRLARRSDTSIPGYAVLLDQDFTVVLNGSQSVVEAVAESSFNLSHPDSVRKLRVRGEYHGRGSSYHVLEALCEGVCLTVFVLCWLLFRPTTTLGVIAPTMAVGIIGGLLHRSPPDHFGPLQKTWFMAKGLASRALPPFFFLTMSLSALDWQHFLLLILLVLFAAGYRPRNYPIRSEKFLDALGHPRVRKWQFDTVAAAATFQCRLLCRGLVRPIRNIDVSAFLDMLVPDQRDVWKAWKERMADRIVHEVDIKFAPTIPTFGDERQQQLKELLDQAQFGDDTYRRFYE